MRVLLLNILLILYFSANLISQQWISFNEDTLYPGNPKVEGFYNTDTVLYVGGWFPNGGNTSLMGAGIWDNTQWDSLDAGVSGGGGIHCFALYKNKLYAGGGFQMQAECQIQHV